MAQLSDGSGHYPYQVPIDAYGNGGFRFADMSHRGSLICLPSGMHAWPVNGFAEVSVDSLSSVFAHSGELDVCLIGLGKDIRLLDKNLRNAFAEANIIVEAIGTGSAVRTYNILLAEKRAIAGAFIAVEHAGRS